MRNFAKYRETRPRCYFLFIISVLVGEYPTCNGYLPLFTYPGSKQGMIYTAEIISAHQDANSIKFLQQVDHKFFLIQRNHKSTSTFNDQRPIHLWRGINYLLQVNYCIFLSCRK